MQGSIDLDAYLRRVGWHGRVAADLASLRGLAVAHVATIPFENLTPLLGLPVELDTPALERKLVHEGRGGYCFEQNLLFAAVLRTIGFEVLDPEEWIAGQVAAGSPEGRVRFTLGMYQAAAGGWFAGVDQLLENLIGREPRTVRAQLAGSAG